ncbi:heme-binding domain-containing protein [Solitalea koreensis]|uniref:Haem-binding domain-containing protein n=1 Tax=Solitalea koreensis TaxID=543615 RepID=A0A521BQ36_9SPHI|nr:heme-binding domain-containing protein [Solitalea koreensis]SMO49282.1 Haem-binding domain-containing protein [Solitalea koreensis]
MKRKIILGILVFFALIQFIRPAKNKASEIATNDIRKQYAMPANVEQSMQTACFDCHSNNTVYPWYSNIQPVAWWLQHHVNEGKEELNFSEFATYNPKKANHKLDKVIKSQQDNWMPLDSYLWIHKDAQLSQQQKDAIITWAKGVQQQIKAANPGVDFSIKKK